MTYGGYSDVAAYLTAQTGRKITRQQVFLWNTRRTLNAAGQAFPSPANENPKAASRRPRLLFRLEDTLAWVSAGNSPRQRQAHEREQKAAGITVYTPVLYWVTPDRPATGRR